ncbi:hypothetical protein ABK040_013497 [Willaertia magna]
MSLINCLSTFFLSPDQGNEDETFSTNDPNQTDRYYFYGDYVEDRLNQNAQYKVKGDSFRNNGKSFILGDHLILYDNKDLKVYTFNIIQNSAVIKSTNQCHYIGEGYVQFHAVSDYSVLISLGNGYARFYLNVYTKTLTNLVDINKDFSKGYIEVGDGFIVLYREGEIIIYESSKKGKQDFSCFNIIRFNHGNYSTGISQNIKRKGNYLQIGKALYNLQSKLLVNYHYPFKNNSLYSGTNFYCQFSSSYLHIVDNLNLAYNFRNNKSPLTETNIETLAKEIIQEVDKDGDTTAWNNAISWLTVPTKFNQQLKSHLLFLISEHLYTKLSLENQMGDNFYFGKNILCNGQLDEVCKCALLLTLSYKIDDAEKILFQLLNQIVLGRTYQPSLLNANTSLEYFSSLSDKERDQLYRFIYHLLDVYLQIVKPKLWNVDYFFWWMDEIKQNSWLCGIQTWDFYQIVLQLAIKEKIVKHDSQLKGLLLLAVNCGSIELLTVLKEKVDISVFETPIVSYGDNALYVAAANGNNEIVMWLLEHTNLSFKSLGCFMQSHFHFFSAKRFEDEVTKGKNSFLEAVNNNDLQTVKHLHHIFGFDLDSIVETFVKYKNYEALEWFATKKVLLSTGTIREAYKLATQIGWQEGKKILLMLGECSGRTVLYAAIMKEDLDFIKYAIENLKVDINHVEDSKTPLQLAISRNNFTLVKYLLEKKAAYDKGIANYALTTLGARANLEMITFLHLAVKIGLEKAREIL